ncbi:PLASTID MOVEMENT IMPAIRED PROTEIN-RELATED [Salix koriyanagi]|uniref:PLASTID MOVEMENT IMPAIRED PROTEIN-RELATED n=1 Tax=Salix koriyanagi TaxID=2511006 RepID=A0A9Q0WS88_9ROSI|nr:PLASTID MOVEMENT IMPAIRED PROTEIN-RELATED [Salix koriyanagi]
MGNSLGWKKDAKVMKISGETFKFKTPVKAGEVVKDYPGHVLLESEAVKHYGIRAKPLKSHQDLVPKRLYFLVELPESAPADQKVPRRVRSGISMSAKDRLESLMLARRSTSDLSIINPASIAAEEAKSGAMRVKMRLPRAEVEKLMQESRDETEAAAKIVDLCMASTAGGSNNSSRETAQNQESALLQQPVHWKSGHGKASSQGIIKTREKRVSFLPVSEAEMQIAVASY